jgi:polysaccharide export outer membrane protein
MKRIPSGLFVAASACLAGPLAYPQVSQPQPQRAAPSANPSATPYRIGPEDVLVISVWQNPELTRSVPVRPDGRISLPLLKDVVAAGRTPAELAEEIETRLKAYMTTAVVSVIVAEVNSYSVSVLGKVARPGRYPFKAPTTVLEVLAAAGGMVEYAKTDEILVLRPDPSRRVNQGGARSYLRLKFNYSAAIKAAGPAAANFELLANDIVVVE